MAAQPEGGRNQGLFWAACRLVEDGHPIEVTIATVGTAGVEAGLPQAEVDVDHRLGVPHRCPPPPCEPPGPYPGQ